MKTTAHQVRNDPAYKLVDPEELPVPEVYRHQVTGNCVYLANGRAYDRFIELKDVNGVLFYGPRKSGFLAKIGNIFEAAAGLVILGTSPKVKIVLDLFNVNTDQIGKAMDKVNGVVRAEAVQVLMRELGTEELQQVYGALQRALSDNVLTTDEWKEIQALAQLSL